MKKKKFKEIKLKLKEMNIRKIYKIKKMNGYQSVKLMMLDKYLY